ncbi:MAG: Gfo/Idh/MocA family oxidoreductase [Armatimonadota bacterium]|nr:Gfo/Idh/MocA family oxidoreductase [Armatimonadota bacterium]
MTDTRLPIPEAVTKIRAVVIGAGSMANAVHYPSLSHMEDVEIAAICDVAEAALHSTADKYQIEARFNNYRQMIETTAPDAVYAIGPPPAMYDIWVWCLQQGLNLYIEKPLGVTLHQAQILAYLAEKHQVTTQVSFQRRTCPLLTMLHGECICHGPVSHAVCSFYKSEAGPHLGPLGRVIDDGVHAIDTLRWICGGEVVDVQPGLRHIGGPDVNLALALLHFENGATGVLMNNWNSGRRIFRVEIHAPGICAEGDPEGEGRLYAGGDTQGTHYTTREAAGSDQLYVYGGFLAKHREFIDAIRAGT